MPNKELLLRTLALITVHPERHEQNQWAQGAPCGTAFCFAGWAAVLSGDKLSWQLTEDGLLGADLVLGHDIDDPRARWADVPAGYHVVMGPDFIGYRKTIGRSAGESLGLDSGDAECLFASENDLDTIRDLVAEFLGVELDQLDELLAPYIEEWENSVEPEVEIPAELMAEIS